MFCLRPFYMLIVEPGGQCRSCCEAHCSKSFGGILAKGPEGIWHGDDAKEMRESILDGSYRFCLDACPILQRIKANRESKVDPAVWSRDLGSCVVRQVPNPDGGPSPSSVHICHDVRCNLRCQKCWQWRMKSDEKVADEVGDLAVGLLKGARDLTMTGCGELFFSPSYAKVLEKVEGMNNIVKFHAITNGTLFTPRKWRSIGRVSSKISMGSLRISVDAATAETYAKVRAGGDFKALVENLRFFGTRPISLKMMSMVVEEANFREMPAFVRFASSLGFKSVLEMLVGPDDLKPWLVDRPCKEEFDRLFAEAVATPGLLWTNFPGAGK